VQTSAQEASVYTARGRKLASFAAAWTAWSPNGNTLASLTLDGTFQTRAEGAGAPTLELDGLNPDPFGQDDLGWIGGQKVRYLTPAGWEGLEVATRIPFTLPRGFADGSSVASPDGLEAAAGIAKGGTWTLELSKLGGPTHTLAKAAGCDGEDPFAGVEFAPTTGSLVYMSGCFDPPGDLYSVSPDGSDLERLTRSAADETDPTVSPDGSTIAYVRSADLLACPTCGDSIWLANADGSDPRRLTKPTAGVDTPPPDDASPSFSPDGTQIMFERDSDTSSDLYVVPAAGGSAKDLGVEGYFPSWGPQRIAYVDYNLVEMTAAPDGSDPQPFAVNGRLVAGPTAWSSDGRLALLAGVDNVSTIVLSTGQKIPLPGLQLAAQAGGITWSPDGTELAFIAADSSGVADVYTVGVDGSGLTRITHDLGATSGISWR
jgi:dipeptidyl aminopeptidase/acylaminoacyl peptidase